MIRLDFDLSGLACAMMAIMDAGFRSRGLGLRGFTIASALTLAACGDPTSATDAGTSTSDTSAGEAGEVGCSPGDTGCECSDGLCLAGLECVNGYCMHGSATSGTVLWTEVFDLDHQDNQLFGVAVNSDDEIFVSGYRATGDGGLNGIYRKYRPDGEFCWHEEIDGDEPTGSSDILMRMTVDEEDYLVLGGRIERAGMGRMALLGKYDQDGKELWSEQFFPGGQVMAVATAPGGDIVATGIKDQERGFVRRYDKLGDLMWNDEVDFGLWTRGRDVTFLGDGRIAVAFERGRNTRVYTAGGTPAWDYAPADCYGFGIAADGDDLVLAGCTDNTSGAWFAELSSVDGSQTWSSGWLNSSTAYDVTLDAMGNVIVVGQEFVLNHGFDMVVRKYAPNGTALIWEYFFDGPEGLPDSAYAVAVDSEGNVIVAGSTDVDVLRSDAVIIKLAG